MAGEMRIIGRTGLNRYGGTVYEELHPKLKGGKAVAVYQEMRDNDPVIGAILFLIDMLIRQSKWSAEPASEDPEDVAAAEFLDQCRQDMSHTWEDLISEILSMLVFGWSYHEIVYKRRAGPSKNPTRNSRFTDGKIGWRKIEIRAQETLDQWEFDDDGGIQGMWQMPPEGGRFFLPIEKCLLFRTRSTKNNPEGRSMLRNAYTSWWYVKNIKVFEAIGVERDLAGLPIMEVPPEIMHPSAPADKASLRTALERMMSEIKRDERASVVIPAEEYTDANGKIVKTGYKFRLLTSGGSRQIDTDKIIRRYEQRIAMTVLAEFILLGMDKVGSFALASSKTNLFAVAIGALLDMIAAVFNRYAVPRLFALNGLQLKALPTLVPGDVETPPLEEVGKFLFDTVRAGIIKPDDKLERWARRQAKMPEPEESEL